MGLCSTLGTMKMKVNVAQTCLTLCDPMEYTVQGILHYWSALPFPSPGDLPNPGTESRSPALQAESLSPEPQEKWTMKKRRKTAREDKEAINLLHKFSGSRNSY